MSDDTTPAPAPTRGRSKSSAVRSVTVFSDDGRVVAAGVSPNSGGGSAGSVSGSEDGRRSRSSTLSHDLSYHRRPARRPPAPPVNGGPASGGGDVGRTSVSPPRSLESLPRAMGENPPPVVTDVVEGRRGSHASGRRKSRSRTGTRTRSRSRSRSRSGSHVGAAGGTSPAALAALQDLAAEGAGGSTAAKGSAEDDRTRLNVRRQSTFQRMKLEEAKREQLHTLDSQLAAEHERANTVSTTSTDDSSGSSPVTVEAILRLQQELEEKERALEEQRAQVTIARYKAEIAKIDATRSDLAAQMQQLQAASVNEQASNPNDTGANLANGSDDSAFFGDTNTNSSSSSSSSSSNDDDGMNVATEPTSTVAAGENSNHAPQTPLNDEQGRNIASSQDAMPVPAPVPVTLLDDKNQLSAPLMQDALSDEVQQTRRCRWCCCGATR